MKKNNFLLLILFVLGCLSCQKKVPETSLTIKPKDEIPLQDTSGLDYFFNRLEPEHIESIKLIRDSVDNFWWEFFQVSKNINNDEHLKSKAISSSLFGSNRIERAPSIRAMLTYPLRLDNGMTVREVFPDKMTDENKSIRIGKAICDNNAPLIVYALKWENDIDSIALTFFRFHEFAHHRLGHSACFKGVKSHYQAELDADCEAARILQQIHPDGIRIVDNVHGLFWYLQPKDQPTHPSSRKRAKNIYLRKCDP